VNRRSLTFRLVSWYCGLLLLLGGGFAAFTFVSFDRYLEAANRAALSARADALWNMTGGALGDRNALADLIERRFAPEALARFIRISIGGSVVYRSGEPVEREFDPGAVPPQPAGISPQSIKVGDLYLYVKSFTAADGRVVTVESGQSADQVVAAERRLIRLLLFGLPILLVFAAGGGYALVQRALSPVEAMIEAAEAFTFNSPRQRLPLAGTGDRLDVLGRALNRMLERLDNAYQHASRFSADAAHELRTPLAIMRGELELLAEAPDLGDDIQKAVANVLGETVRLGQMVSSLTAMSQLDSVSGKRLHLAVDLHALATETIDQIRLLADDKNITIDGPPGPPVVAAGDRDRLKQVLVNLLDNALKYTHPGGHIAVRTYETADSAVLEVADTGVGIPREHLPHVFDRFYRVDADRGEIGAGLGLAIVKSICAAHGGQVAVESQHGNGSVFWVSLPRAADGLEPSHSAHDGPSTPPLKVLRFPDRR